MNRFRELRVWQEAIDVAQEIYILTQDFPQVEKFGLISQMRRSAVSISSNIAEGAGRNNSGEFSHFIGIAIGSSFELESQLVLATNLGFCEIKNSNDIINC